MLDSSSLHGLHLKKRLKMPLKVQDLAPVIRANPVLLDRDGNILAGHGRIEAAKSLGLSVVPTLDIGSMSDETTGPVTVKIQKTNSCFII